MDKECCFIGRGNISIRETSNTSPNPNKTFFVGNASVFNVTPQFEEKTRKDYRTAVGNACQTKLITNLNVNLTVDCMKSDILALAMGGEVTAIASATVTAEQHLVNDEEDIIHLNFIASKTAFSVTNSAGSTTYVLGTDYKYITPNSKSTSRVTAIQILPASAIAATDTIKITYTKVAQKEIDPYLFIDKTFTLFFDGFNAEDASGIYAIYWSVKLGQATHIDWISDDYVQLEFAGEVLYDDTLGQYARIQRENLS